MWWYLKLLPKSRSHFGGDRSPTPSKGINKVSAMKKSKTNTVLISFLFLMYGLTACYVEETKSSVQLPHEEFSINTTTILEDISQGRKDIFIPVENRVPINEIEYFPVNWTQNNYMAIANSVHKFAWNEELNDWKLNSILFYFQCQEAPYGSQSVYLTYFKLIKNDVEEYRLVHNIVIQPQEKIVGAWAEKYSQLTMTWEEYAISEFKITSDEALRIAENNGGKSYREINNNDCSISISLNRTARNNRDWIVDYSSNFEFIIDPNTGEYRVNK